MLLIDFMETPEIFDFHNNLILIECLQAGTVWQPTPFFA